MVGNLTEILTRSLARLDPPLVKFTQETLECDTNKRHDVVAKNELLMLEDLVMLK